LPPSALIPFSVLRSPFSFLRSPFFLRPSPFALSFAYPSLIFRLSSETERSMSEQ
jgi:hypothetical protein